MALLTQDDVALTTSALQVKDGTPSEPSHCATRNLARTEPSNTHFIVGFFVATFIQLNAHLLPFKAGTYVPYFGWALLGIGLWLLLWRANSRLERACFAVIGTAVALLFLISVGRTAFMLLFSGLIACLSAALAERLRQGFVRLTIALGSVPILTYGLFQFAGVDWNRWNNVFSSPVHAGIGTSNHLASVAALVLLVAFFPSAMLPRTLRLLLGAASFTVLVATESRSGLMACLMFVILMLAYRRMDEVPSTLLKVGLSASLSALAAPFIILGLSTLNSTYTLEKLLHDGSLSTRFSLVSSLGSRLDGLTLLLGSSGAGPTSTDNLLGDIIVSQGILGFLPIVALCWLVTRRSYNKLNFDSMTGLGDRYRNLFLFAAFSLAALPHSVTPVNSVLFWMLLGSSVALPKLFLPERVSRIPPGRLGIISSVVCLAGLIIALLTQTNPFRPPDSPGFLPYPAASPLPFWYGAQISLDGLFALSALTIVLCASLVWGILLASEEGGEVACG